MKTRLAPHFPMPFPGMAATLALASTLALISTSARADVVWNVNIGNQDLAGYQGAAAENTAGSTWNAVTSTGPTTLADSTGDSSAGVAIEMTPTAGNTINFGTTNNTTGDQIFKQWMKDDGNNAAYSVTFGGLDTTATYDLVVYSGWFWGPEAVHTAQTAGTGLAGTFVINSLDMGPDPHALETGFAEDTDPTDVAGDTNYARFNGLASDGSGNLTFEFNLAGDLDAPINGFQLIEKDLADNTPPTPNPMEWAIGGEPAAAGESSITMTATTATDPGGVEYKFTNVTWPDDTHDSPWQSSATYTDTGLVPNTPYSYTVEARDANENETAASDSAEATTDAADATAPTPDPMEWETDGEPAAVSTSEITMTAAEATDAEGNGVEYFFTCTVGGGNDSGWQDDPVYTDTGLLPSTAYSYTVKARDKSLGQNETAPSTPAAEATTNTPAPVAANTVWNVNIGNNIDESDDYVGAASANTANSTWNSITADGTGMPLLDSTGSGAAGVTMDLTGTGHGATAVMGDDIWQQWTKSSDNSTPFTLAFGNLNPGVTYDLILYSEWYWAGEGGMPVTQTVGTGLAGTIHVNHDPGANGDPVGALAEDTDPADVDGPFNWYRITGLTPDAGGKLAFSMGGVNGPFNGCQLIGAPKDTGLKITSFTSVGGGTWQLTLAGDPGTDYEFRSSTTLVFNPGTLENLTAGDPAVGTVAGTVVTTDSNGDGTVRVTLAGPANFVRAQIPPPPPLQGASFEDPVTPNFSPEAPTHWAHQNSGVGEVGVWLPGVPADYDSIPDGSQVGYVYSAAIPNAAFGLSQMLGATFAANTDYQVTVQVGRSKTYDWPNYRVELWAGSILLASDDNTLSPAAGGWVTSTVSYDSNTGPAATPGDALEIRLLSRGEDPENGSVEEWQVEFDQVTFTATGP